MAYYFVSMEVVDHDSFYIKAKSKKEAFKKAQDKLVFSFVRSYDVETIGKKEYEEGVGDHSNEDEDSEIEKLLEGEPHRIPYGPLG